jgi:hypothetical protein
MLWKDAAAATSSSVTRGQALELDLTENQVEVLHCTVLDAVEVEGLEDFGPGYFLDLGDSTLLHVQGQYLLELEDEGRFPNRQLRIVRTPHARISFAFECLGETFEPSRRVDVFTGQEYVPDDGEILRARLDTLQADLRRLEQDRRRRT